MHRTARIALFVPDDVYISSLGAIADVAEIADSLALSRQFDLGRNGSMPPSGFQAFGFSTDLLSIDGRSVRAASGVSISVKGSVESASTRYACVFIPAFNFKRRARLTRTLARYRPLYAWLVSQRRRGALIAANGASVFLLAEAGLLDNRRATIGWWLEEDLRKRYPDIDVDASRQITESDGLFCANTLGAALDLSCRILERLSAPPVAQTTAEITFGFAAEGRGLSGDTDLPSVARDTLLAKAQFWFARNYASKATLAQLAKYVGASERTLIRRFKDVLGLTPRTYLRNLRMLNAQRLLTQSSLTVPQVAAQVGYEDVDFFKKSFKAHTGHSPTAYRSARQPVPGTE